MQLSKELQLREKTWNRTEDQKKGRISQGDQRVYDLQVFQRFSSPHKENFDGKKIQIEKSLMQTSKRVQSSNLDEHQHYLDNLDETSHPRPCEAVYYREIT